MVNPYAPRKPVSADASQLTWLSTVLAIVAGMLSLSMAGGIISNFLIFAQIPQRPTSLSEVAGISAMTGVMLTSSVGFAVVSYGLLVARASIWKRGLWTIAASLISFLACIVYAYALFRSRSA